MAKKYSYNTTAGALLKPAEGATFFEEWNPETDNRNHALLCAEMSRLAYADKAIVKPALAGIGFSSVDFFGTESVAGRVATRGTQGFVAKHPAHGVTVLAFRGTESGKIEDLFVDAATWQTPFPRGGNVHAGFDEAYDSVRTQIATLVAQREGSLVVTGHSLGAALATVAATEVAPDKLITFGSPRVGDKKFCARLDDLVRRPAVQRFVNCCDVVARVPPEVFDQTRLYALFAELGDLENSNLVVRGLAGKAAELLAAAIGASGAADLFAHVEPPRYVDSGGMVRDGWTAGQQTADQKTARQAYPRAGAAALTHLAAVFRSFALLPGEDRTPRAFLRALFALPNNIPIPLRDLADHAPINYVSGITGRAV